MSKMKDLLQELIETAEPDAEVTKNVTACPVVASAFKPLDALDFVFGKGNFVPLWHAAKVANQRLGVLTDMNDRLVAKNKSLTAALELLRQQQKHRGD